jgi:hypothetical protein
MNTASTSQDLPVFQDSSLWLGSEMAQRTDWMHPLTSAEVNELDAAVAHAKSVHANLVDLTAEQFPLPTLGSRLKRIRHGILHGHGFALLRGWPSADRSLEDSAYVFRGVGAHLGEALSQNGKGHIIGHVANLGLDYSDPTTRGYQTTAELRYHSDAGDIVGLLCVKPARTGGLSKISSATAVWNEMVRRRPDLARELLKPTAYSRWGEVGAGQKPVYVIPPFHVHEGRLITVYIMGAVTKAQSFENVDKISDTHKEALMMVNTIADEPGIRLDMDFKPGDMQFLCNHFTLHSRTSYEDWPEVENRRHLLRIWLACEDGPSLPDYMTEEFQGKTVSGRPNGINVPGVARCAPLTPV